MDPPETDPEKGTRAVQFEEASILGEAPAGLAPRLMNRPGAPDVSGTRTRRGPNEDTGEAGQEDGGTKKGENPR